MPPGTEPLASTIDLNHDAYLFTFFHTFPYPTIPVHQEVAESINEDVCKLLLVLGAIKARIAQAAVAVVRHHHDDCLRSVTVKPNTDVLKVLPNLFVGQKCVISKPCLFRAIMLQVLGELGPDD